MNRTIRSLTALFFALLLLIGILPSGAYAEDEPPELYMLVIDYVDMKDNAMFDSYSAFLYPGEEYSVDSPYKEGYDYSAAVVSGVMEHETINVTVFYTPAEQPLQINYYIGDSTEPFDDYYTSVPTGSTYSVLSPYVTDYEPDTSVVEGIMPAGGIVITVRYTQGAVPTHVLKLILLYSDGTQASEPMTYLYHEGEHYGMSAPYVDDSTCETPYIEGTMGLEDMTVTLIYTRNLHSVTVRYEYPDGRIAADTFGASYYKGDKYTVVSPHIDGYAPDRQTVQGIVWEKSVSITVKYSPAVYTLTGLPIENATVTVNGKSVTPEPGGKLTVSFGDTIRVIPDNEYAITQFRRLAPDPVIILQYPVDVWDDGSGYQLLLDADHDLYPALMDLGAAGSTDRFDSYGSFDGFEYFVPTDAVYTFTPGPGQAVFGGETASASVPAGTYDLAIINPSSGYYDGIFFVGMSVGFGDFPKGRKDDVVFEKGRTYEFMVSFLGLFGDYAVCSSVTTGPADDCDFGTADEDGSYYFTMPSQDVDLLVTVSRKVIYDLSGGDNAEYTLKSGNALRFIFSRNFDDQLTIERFEGASVDGTVLTEGSDYTKSAGSVIVELKPSFMDKLAPGNHTLTVSFSDSEDITVPFTVRSAAVPPGPDTGMYSNMLLYAWLLAAAALVAYELKMLRRRSSGGRPYTEKTDT